MRSIRKIEKSGNGICMICTTPKALGAWFRSERRKKGYTQQDIAARAAVTQRAVSEFETGRTDVGLVRLLRLLNAAGLTLDVKAAPENSGDEEW